MERRGEMGCSPRLLMLILAGCRPPMPGSPCFRASPDGADRILPADLLVVYLALVLILPMLLGLLLALLVRARRLGKRRPRTAAWRWLARPPSWPFSWWRSRRRCG